MRRVSAVVGRRAGGVRDDQGVRGRAAPDALAAVAAALRSGATPAVAWRRAWALPVEEGVPRWEDLLARCHGDAATASAVLAAARLAHECGTAPAALLDRLADVLADEQEVAGERRAAMAGPRATARLLAWLPAVGLGLGWAVGARPLAVLLDGGVGSALACGAVLLTVGGRAWGEHLLASAEAAGRA